MSKPQTMIGRSPADLEGALRRDMARVREEVLPAYQAMGAAGSYVLYLARKALEEAEASIATGNNVGMIAALHTLEGFDSVPNEGGGGHE